MSCAKNKPFSLGSHFAHDRQQRHAKDCIIPGTSGLAASVPKLLLGIGGGCHCAGVDGAPMYLSTQHSVDSSSFLRRHLTTEIINLSMHSTHSCRHTTFARFCHATHVLPITTSIAYPSHLAPMRCFFLSNAHLHVLNFPHPATHPT